MNYPAVDLQAKKSQALIVHCADPRFQKAYRTVIDEIGLYYDLVVLPGASKAISDSQLARDYIKMLHNLHEFDSIHVLDHIECGAFGNIKNEITAHRDYHQKAKEALKKILPGIQYAPYLLGEESCLELT